MTNAEKYKEVFGMEVDPSMCPTTTCDVCPCCNKDSEGNVACVGSYTYEWWDEEYKEERPHGEWIPNDKISPWGNPGRSCSLCGKIVEFSENFCPKCGADMRGIYNDKKETT